MNLRRLAFVLASLVGAMALAFGLSLANGAGAGPGDVASATGAGPSVSFKHVCGPAAASFARCHAILRVNPDKHRPPTPTPTTPGSPTPTPTPPIGGCVSHGGYTPCDLQSAYSLPSATAGSGQTVAIVDAFDDPNAESDLGVYRSNNGLSACTTANGCFRKVDQNGGTQYPAGNVGWAQEISLDVDMVSAICPNCHILLVEANDNSFANLAAAVDEAATLGANAISNSYGASESSQALGFASHYNHPGSAVTASSGDSGFGVQFPADLQYVTAVGGTSLTHASNSRGWSETAWSGAGSGCSSLVAQPSWQSSNTGPSPTCRRMPTPTRASTSTILMARLAGWSLAARAWPRRSSPVSMPWPATRPASATARSRTATPAACTTLAAAAMGAVAAICATRRRAGTGRPAMGRPTAPAHSER